MKKVFALILAVIMALCATNVAFATYGDENVLDSGTTVAGLNVKQIVNYGDHAIYLTAPVDFRSEVDVYDGRLLPGETYQIKVADILAVAGTTTITDPADVKSVTLKSVRNAALVNAVSLHKKNNADAYVEILLNENHYIHSPKSMEFKITFETRDRKKETVTIHADVANYVIEVEGYNKRDDAKDNSIVAYDNVVYRCENSGYVTFLNNDDMFLVTARLLKGKTYFMYSNPKIDIDVEETYAEDHDADLYYFRFVGTPSLSAGAEYIFIAPTDDQFYLYKMVDKKLEPLICKYDKDAGEYRWNDTAPTTYIASTKALDLTKKLPGAETAAPSTPSTLNPDIGVKNPDTGNHSAVGLATGLAALAAVCGVAAVVVKKKAI